MDDQASIFREQLRHTIDRIDAKLDRIELNQKHIQAMMEHRLAFLEKQAEDHETRNRAGQVFRQAAASVMRADCIFGAFYRRQKARLGPAQALVATAHWIARVVYRMLKYQVEYEPLSVEEYEKHYREQQIKYLERKAAKLGFQLSPA